MLQSFSWPIPVTTGTADAKIARATNSSLNGNRSSGEPPPLAKIIKSISVKSLNEYNASDIKDAALSP